MASADRIDLRPLEERDRGALAALLAEPWPDVPWRRRFALQWDANPWCTPERARGWVLADASGAPQGCFGSIPLPWRVDGRDVLAFGATALYVREPLRGRGLARRLVQAWLDQPGGELWINATPNEPSAQLFESLGFERTVRGEREEQLVHVLDGARHLRDALAARLGSGALARGLASLAGSALGPALHALRQRGGDGSGEAEWSWTPARSDEPALDELWTRERDRLGASLRRDAELWRWLCFDGEREARTALLLGRDERGRARALALLAQRDGELVQLDGLGDVDAPAAALGLARAAKELARAAGCASARLLDRPGGPGPVLRHAGFAPHPRRRAVWWRAREGAALGVRPSFGDLDGDGFLELA